MAGEGWGGGGGGGGGGDWEGPKNVSLIQFFFVNIRYMYVIH